MGRIKKNKPRKPAATGMVGRQADKEMQPGKAEAVDKDVGQFVNNAIGMMYEDEYYASNVNILKQQSPKSDIEKVSEVGVPIMQRITEMARKKGVEVGFETLANSGPIIVNEILEIAENEGAFTLNDEEKQAALALAVQNYMDVQFEAGVYDKQQIATEMSAAVEMLPPEARAELEKQVEQVNKGVATQVGGANGKLV